MRIFLFCSLLVLCNANVCADEPLDPRAKAWIDHYQETRQQTSQAYLYLLGMDAPENTDVLAHGQQKLAVIKRLEADIFAGTPQPIGQGEALQHLPRLELMDQSLFCGSERYQCYRTLIESDNGLQTNEYPQNIWLARYQNYLRYRDYQTLTRPHLTEVIPPNYVNQQNANQLLLRQAINEQQIGHCHMAEQLIRDDINAWRYHLHAADRLVQKIIYVNFIGNGLEILGYLQQAGCQQPVRINPLSSEELSMHRVIEAEFILGMNVIDMFFGPGSIYEPESDRAIGRNEGVNYLFSILDPVARFNDIAGDNPLKAYAKINKIFDLLLEQATPAEKLFFGDEPSSILEYPLKVYELNAKIALFNALVSDEINSASHPYIKSSRVIHDSEMQAWCFDQGLIEQQFNRCIGDYSP